MYRYDARREIEQFMFAFVNIVNVQKLLNRMHNTNEHAKPKNCSEKYKSENYKSTKCFVIVYPTYIDMEEEQGIETNRAAISIIAQTILIL